MTAIENNTLFDNTATGTLGLHRPTMLSNHLHQRDQLSKPLSRCYTVPDESFTFGRRTNKTSAVSDSMTWPASYNFILQRDSNNCGSNSNAPRDYLAMNREAVKAGLASARELADFRAAYDIRRKPASQSRKGNRNIFPTGRIPPTTVFGIGTRPSTPLSEILANKYQDEWIEQNLRNKPVNSSLSEQCNRTLQALDTRSSLLRTHIVPIEEKSCWKLSRFEKRAAPCIDSFRTSEERDAAWRTYLSDKIGREGVIGGVYTSSKY